MVLTSHLLVDEPTQLRDRQTLYLKYWPWQHSPCFLSLYMLSYMSSRSLTLSKRARMKTWNWTQQMQYLSKRSPCRCVLATSYSADGFWTTKDSVRPVRYVVFYFKVRILRTAKSLRPDLQSVEVCPTDTSPTANWSPQPCIKPWRPPSYAS